MNNRVAALQNKLNYYNSYHIQHLYLKMMIKCQIQFMSSNWSNWMDNVRFYIKFLLLITVSGLDTQFNEPTSQNSIKVNDAPMKRKSLL